MSVRDKIAKLEAMTVERGATEGEAANARALAEKLRNKLPQEQSPEIRFNQQGMPYQRDHNGCFRPIRVTLDRCTGNFIVTFV